VKAPYIAFMPQWDFLDFLADRAREICRASSLLMNTTGETPISANGCVVGLEAKTPEGEISIRADLVVAADGRHSDVRQAAGLAVTTLGAPIDVLWFRLSRKQTDDNQTFGQIAQGRFMVMLNRTDYWQCAFVIPKGTLEVIRSAGLDAFRRDIAALSPAIADRVGELTAWDDIKLLSVAVDRLERWWKPGLLCIGDAAHAMSPIGGVGVNLAIQDAVATANRLAVPLREKRLTDADLAAVQERRMFPTKVTQAMQIAVQNRVITELTASETVR
jgi:2-polyprenyl-6-methoxyphenol hydroxylase-like FAD-dependent oxidoreductase